MVVTSLSFVTYPAVDSMVDSLKPRRLLLLHADIVDLHLSLHVDFHLLYVNPFQMSTLYGQSKRLTLWLHVDIVDLHYCTLWTPKALQLRRLPLHVDILDHWPCLLCTLYNQSNCEDYRYNLDFFLLTFLTYIYLVYFVNSPMSNVNSIQISSTAKTTSTHWHCWPTFTCGVLCSPIVYFPRLKELWRLPHL